MAEGKHSSVEAERQSSGAGQCWVSEPELGLGLAQGFNGTLTKSPFAAT